jgi:hypothetical protein
VNDSSRLGEFTFVRAAYTNLEYASSIERALILVGPKYPSVSAIGYDSAFHNAVYVGSGNTNISRQSEVLGTTWAAITVGDSVSSNNSIAPNKETTADSIDCNNTTAECGVRESITLTAAVHTFSAWAKAGQNTVVALRTGVANTTTFFNLSTCAACSLSDESCNAAGTTGSAVISTYSDRFAVDTDYSGTSDAEWCRIGVTFTGTAASTTFDLMCATADNNLTVVDADATANCSFWGVEIEAQVQPTQYSTTTTADTTIAADSLVYTGVAGTEIGSMKVDSICRNRIDTTEKTLFSQRLDSDNDVKLKIQATDNKPKTTGTVSVIPQWSIVGSSGDVTDGSVHTSIVNYNTNDIDLLFDGVSVGTDTSASVMSSHGDLWVGSYFNTENSNCNIASAKVWKVDAP